jgi:hypothetical protein
VNIVDGDRLDRSDIDDGGLGEYERGLAEKGDNAMVPHIGEVG